MDDVEDLDKSESTLSMKSGIPRPTSRPLSRPLSRPTPSARVRALGKDDIDDADDQNTADEDEDDLEEEEEEDEQGIQIEGYAYPVYNARSAYAQTFRSRGYDSRKSDGRQYISRSSDGRLFRTRRRSVMNSMADLHVDPSLEYRDSRFIEDFTPARDGGGDDMVYELTNMILEQERDLYYSRLPFDADRAYDPADFEHLTVSNDMKELFQYITRYTPQTIELDHKLRPFIPEYIPAVGDIDAFIKIPRPDPEHDKLGLVALDEPCAKQSDQTVLDLQLRAISKETTTKAVSVKKLENADKRPKEIDAWIVSIANLHQSKPPPTVHYARNMPDIEELMQEWPPEVEECLNQVNMPTADFDCTLEEYVDFICALFGIPVYKSRIQSVHVLFSLFMEFQNSQHFRALANNPGKYSKDSDDDDESNYGTGDDAE